MERRKKFCYPTILKQLLKQTLQGMFLAILILKLQVKIIQTIQKSNKSCIMP